VDCGFDRSFRIRSRGHNIENGLYWDGFFAHEPRTMALWVEQAEAADVVLDIGANSGVFALAAAAVGAKSVHAFEPVPRVYRILAENLELNAKPQLHAWPCAVGEKSGSATIFDPGGDAPTSASLSSEFALEHLGQTSGVDVDVVSIDQFCKEHGIDNVDLVKIDVEGYEEFALRGMQETVGRCTPVILMEVLDGQTRKLRDVVEALWPSAYSWSQIDEGPGHVSRNVLLRPRALR
jgi:FkbM family methyltransferase